MQVILDTDPGVDDAIALLWLLALDLRFRADVVGISTTEGTLRRRAVFGNVARLLELCRRSDIRLAKSAPHRGATNEQAQGHDGLAGVASLLPSASKSYESAPRAPVQLCRWIEAGDGDATVIALGPLTNLEAAEVLKPGTLNQTRQIICRGGSFKSGDVTPHSEFNMLFNPRAMHNVLKARPELVLIPLDVSRQLDLNLEHLRAAGFTEKPTRICKFVMRLVKAMEEHVANTGQRRLFAHGVCGVAYAFYPELFETVAAYIKVDTRLGIETTGKTIIETNPNPNALVARRMNAEAIRDQMLSDVAEFSHVLR